MTTKEAKNWYDNMLDSQKKMAESINESTKKFTSNDQVNQALESGQDFFKKWLDFQMDFVKGTTQNETIAGAEKSLKENMENWKGFSENIFKNQTESLNNSFKQNVDMFNNWVSSFSNNNPLFNSSNPFGQNMNAFGGFNSQMTDMYNNMMSSFNGQGNSKSVFEGMYGNVQSFMKFYEMMSPMFKAMQNNNFSAEEFSKYFTPEAYKGFMDSFFGFLPENMQGPVKEGMNKWNESMKSMGNNPMMDMFKNMGMNNMSNPFQQFMPQGNQVFTDAMNNYNNMYSQMQNAVAPFAKLMTPTSHSINAEAVASIIDMMNRYQIVNAQMQYMTYTTGMKSMDAMGKSIAEKMKEGKTFNNMQELFKEWLNTSDKFFVELFETEEFSKTQAESSALTLRIKHAIDGQMEKMFANVPLVPRSEMEELYKTVYELKKRVRTMEKAAENNTEVVAEKPAAAAKKTAK
jgi:polyhydroxyalkanoate synthase subunit PhaE